MGRIWFFVWIVFSALNKMFLYSMLIKAKINTLVGKTELRNLYRTFEEKVLNAKALEMEEQEESGVECTGMKQVMALLDEESEHGEECENSDVESLPGSEQSEESGKSRESDFTADAFGDSDGDSDDVESSSGEGDSHSMIDSSSDEEDAIHKPPSMEEVHKRKLADPCRLHPELWFNEKGQVS